MLYNILCNGLDREERYIISITKRLMAERPSGSFEVFATNGDVYLDTLMRYTTPMTECIRPY